MPNRAPGRVQDRRRAALPRDEIQIRAFMLADHAVQEQNGKVYLNGGAVEWIGVSDPVETLPILYLVIRLGFPWRLTSEPHEIVVRLLDQDEKPVGSDPVFTAKAELGRPPGAQPGDEFGLNVVFPFLGYKVNARPDTTLLFHLQVDGRELTSLPLKLRRIVQVPGIPR